MSGNRRVVLGAVAIVGGGPVAWIAALAFAQALPGAAVTLVPAPVAPDALADRFPLAMPAVHELLTRLGLAPELLLARGVARPRLASRFRDWSRDGAPWLVGDDDAATVPEGRLSAIWLRALAAKSSVPPFHALVPACVAAGAGRVDPHVEPALHLDPARLMQALTALAGQAGVRTTAPFAAVTREGDGVRAVTTRDGGRIAADLFIDASGSARLLCEAGAPFEDWRTALPCDRLSLAPGAPIGPCDDYRATQAGWTAQWPGVVAQGGATGSGAADDAIAIAPGRLAAPFTGTVIALGEAAAQTGPLGLAGFTLALGQLALMLELLPARDVEPLLRDEYNRRAGLRAARLRDFLALHYHGGGRRQGAFWERIATLPRPATLDRLLTQFARRGLVVAADEDSLPRDAWLSVLLGQGVRPERADPVALSLSPAEAAQIITALARRLSPEPA